MRVSRLDVQHFRNHTDTSVTIPAGVTVFIGSNGQGKTNLVEAVGYVAYQHSPRVSTDRALVQQGYDQAIIRTRVEHEGRFADMAVEIRATGANRAKVNGKSTPMTQLSGWLKAVIFAPEDLALIRGEPAGRRRYIDQTLLILRPNLQPLISDYDRVVRQRNALLKTHRGQPSPTTAETLEGWTQRLIELATDYTLARQQLITQLNPHAMAVYRALAPDHNIAISLDSAQHVDTADPEALRRWYAEQCDARQADEWDRGTTLVGPHRDDIDIQLNGLPSRTHSSHGESWSLALMLRMAQAVLYREDSPSGDPVMILDDVFAELDKTRRARLHQLVADYEQVLITAAVWEDIPEGIAENVFILHAGEVSSDVR